MMIDRTAFHRTFENSPVFQKHMVSALSSRIFDIITRFQKLAFEPLDVRMENLLYSRFHEVNSMSINTTHSQIAQELGTTREVASRMLKELERYGRITLSRGSISLRDKEALGRMCQLAEILERWYIRRPSRTTNRQSL